jgi:hypothetical protein
MLPLRLRIVAVLIGMGTAAFPQAGGITIESPRDFQVFQRKLANASGGNAVVLDQAPDGPPSAGAVAGFSIHPDGKRALISIAKWPFQIWMFEGFGTSLSGGWLARLLHR